MSKLPNHIQNELLGLKNIRPGSAWKQQTHARLLQTLQVPQTSQRLTIFRYAQFVAAYSREMITKLAWQPIGALTLIAVVVVGPSVVTVNAAIGSLPGDALYPVKRSLERARISLTFSNTKRAELELGLVATRLHELQRITKEQAPSPERQQKIALALEELKKDTTTVKTRLEASKTETKSSSQKSETINLAKIIDQKTADYQETLQAAVSELHTDNQTPSSDIGQAITTVQDVAIDALDVLVSNKQAGEQQLSSDQLKAKVEQQLNVTKLSVDALRARLASIPAPVATEAVVSTPQTTDSTATTPSTTETTPSAPTAADLSKKLDEQVVPTVTYAEELLKLRDFTSALDSLSKANKQMDALSKEIQTLQTASAPDAKAEQNTDTTTDNQQPVPTEQPTTSEPTTVQSPDKPQTEESPATTETKSETTTKQAQ